MERIKDTGDIFLAWSDRSWILDGAAVRVSIVGFDSGQESYKELDGKSVQTINADLTSNLDLTRAVKLRENEGIAFRGIFRIGPFDIKRSLAQKLLEEENPSGRRNSDVVKPWVNGSDIVGRSRDMWIIDFAGMSEEEAQQYVGPFNYVKRHVKPVRDKVRRKRRRERWWIYGEHSPGMRAAIIDLERFIASAQVAKYRLFVWLEHLVLPDQKVIVIARDDDYFFGVLHSKVHELWSLETGNWIGKGNDPTYTHSTTFLTFPFPWLPGQEPAEAEDERVYAIAEAARRLVAFRRAWLNPPEEDIGTIIPQRIVNKLTLTNLYNALNLYRDEYKGRIRDRVRWNKAVDGIITLEQVEELDYIHMGLDAAVLDAYGWPHTLTAEQILERLLALNLERAAAD